MIELSPITFNDACIFINKFHRHHKAPQGHKFSIGCIDSLGVIVGVVIVGRPVSRHLDDNRTLEVTRLCTDSTTKNVASKLLRAAWNVTKNLGYKKLITYTLKKETGASLKAAGYSIVGETTGKSWNRESRTRIDKHLLEPRFILDVISFVSSVMRHIIKRVWRVLTIILTNLH